MRSLEPLPPLPRRPRTRPCWANSWHTDNPHDVPCPRVLEPPCAVPLAAGLSVSAFRLGAALVAFALRPSARSPAAPALLASVPLGARHLPSRRPHGQPR